MAYTFSPWLQQLAVGVILLGAIVLAIRYFIQSMKAQDTHCQGCALYKSCKKKHEEKDFLKKRRKKPSKNLPVQ